MWKVLECPKCKTGVPKMLKIEGACADLQCADEECSEIWTEHPFGKSCKHRKLTVQMQEEILKTGNFI